MENENYVPKISALLYIVPATIFSVIAQFVNYIVISNYTGSEAGLYLISITLFVTICTFAVLLISLSNHFRLSEAITDSSARRAAGAVLAVNGLLSLPAQTAILLSYAMSLREYFDINIKGVISSAGTILILALQILLGVYLFKPFKKSDYKTDLAYEIAFLFTAVTGLFSLLSKAVTFKFTAYKLGINSGWFIFLAGILVFLNLNNKRRGRSVTDLIADTTVRKTSGALIIVNALLDSPTIILMFVSRVRLLYMSDAIYRDSKTIQNELFIILLQLTVFIAQVLFGLYLLKLREPIDNKPES
jgi:hypothetical protein